MSSVRANDPLPGNTVMWRGLSRLTDIALGAGVGPKLWVIESSTHPLRQAHGSLSWKAPTSGLSADPDKQHVLV